MWACRAAPCIGADGFKRLKSLTSRKISKFSSMVSVRVHVWLCGGWVYVCIYIDT